MTRVILFFIGLLILISVNSKGQESLSGFISLHISNDSLRFYHSSMKGEISFRIKNESDNSLLIYGLNRGGLGGTPYDKSKLCELDNVGLGLKVIIYNTKGDQLISSASFGPHSYDSSITKSRLDSTLSKYRLNTSSDTTILRQFDKRTFVKPIDISSFELEKGTYFLQIIMYCGSQIYFSVDKERIALDRKRLKADLYQGCTFSNKIKITVD